MSAWLWVACASDTLSVGEFIVVVDRKAGTMDVSHADGATLTGLTLWSGDGTADLDMQFGAFAVVDASEDLSAVDRLDQAKGQRFGFALIDTESRDGVGLLQLTDVGGVLNVDWTPPSGNRVAFEADCAASDHFLGLGAHARDVDHVGEAFALWVQEPGIGKSDDDELPDGWPVVGPKHASSYPLPVALRPSEPSGLVLETDRRVEVDLCADDPDRFRWTTWDDALHLRLVAAETPLEVVARLSTWTGRPALPPEWVFGPWADAIRGTARVEAVATTLREANAPTTAIWTEDWKGGEQTPFGYHLTGEWFVDETLYADASITAASLEDDGLAWLAYFSPFVLTETVTWDDAVAAGVLVADASGDPITFPSPNFELTGLVDLSTPDGRNWAAGYLSAALALGFDGWMADFAEWLPDDAVMADGSTGLDAHNAYPRWWAETQWIAIGNADATFFHRSGWLGSGAQGPMVWAGDQRTSFDADDGLPTVVAMGLSLGASGVPWMTHDVAGYSSTGNDPSTKELWFRWASLGAFSPLYRTHHGAYDLDNWQFDTDAETLAHHVAMTTESMRTHPYRYGLAARATTDGVPMLLPPALVWGGDDWGRTDAWMLGDALLVAPVVEEGATGRDVDLPEGTSWVDWWTHAPAVDGWFASPVGTIPVFAASGTTVPTFAEAPDTLRDAVNPAVRTLADADGARVVYVFGPGGIFVEADGTTYTPTGLATAAAQATTTFASGSVEAGGIRLAVEGTVERTYTLVAVPAGS